MLDLKLKFAGITILAAALAYGQSASRAMKLPAPLWTGQLNDPKQHIYYDIQKNQLVVISDTSAPAALAQQTRYDLPNRANPMILYTINASSGTVIYTYVVNDDANSPQRSKRFSLLLPEHDSGLTAGGAWKFAAEPTTLPDRTQTVSMATMRWVSLEDPSTAPAKVVGLSLGLRSTYLPGFVDALVEGLVAKPLTPEAVSGFDAATGAQLQPFLNRGSQGRPSFLLGPLFRPGAPKLAIGSNYDYGIQRLAHSGELDPNSIYVKTALDHLGTFVRGQGAVSFVPVDVAPTTPLEQQIQNGLNMSMR